MAARPSIRLIYDVTSPYSYVAFHVMNRTLPQWSNKVDFILEPVFLGFILKESKNPPPAFHPVKVKYMLRDLKRLKQLHQLPNMLLPPTPFPTQTLYVQRLLHAIKTSSTPSASEDLRLATERLFAAYWEQNKDMKDGATLKKALDGMEHAELYLNRSQTEPVKQSLVETSERLVKEEGCFGNPTFIVVNGKGEKDVFFGSDRFDHIAWFLGEKYVEPIGMQTRPKM